MLRWSNKNKEKIFREQPFGGVLSEFKYFEGYYLTKHLQQRIESDHFRVKKKMPKIGGFQIPKN